MITRPLVILGSALALFGAVACNGDDDDGDDDDGGRAGSVSGSSGRGGASGKAGGGAGGASGKAGGGAGGASGKAGGGGSSGASGEAGSGATNEGGEAGAEAGAGGETAAGAAGAGAGEAGAGGAPPALSDAAILHVVITANTGEVEEGELAVMRAQATDVQDFAEMMVDDHGMAVQEATTLGSEEGLTPEPNPVSTTLEQEAEAKLDELSNADEGDFDQLYIDSQVEAHEAVLELLDTTLVPQADDSDLRAFLTSMRATVATHLELATDIQADLD